MPQSLANIVLHTIFSTKNRVPHLRDSTLRSDTFAYLGGAIKTLNCTPRIIGGHDDHVHLLSTLPRTLTVADFVKETKRASTKWMKNERGIPDFAWQSGYGVFSVSESMEPKVSEYIANQEEHHRELSFKDEYRAFLKKHNVPYDEKYVWD